jgi:penicillin-binding protein 2
MNRLDSRRLVILLIFITVGLLFTARLLYMQVFTNKWTDRAAQISEYKLYTYPARGIIYDRTGKKMVENATFYDLILRANQFKPFDTAGLAALVGLPQDEVKKKIRFARKQSYYLPYEFVKQLRSEQFEIISEQLFNYAGVHGQERTMRGYPLPVAAHLLGYLKEVDSSDIKENPYYRSRDYIGKGGLEQAYEAELRGVRGVQYILRDAIGEESGSYENGKYDTLPKPGKNIYSSIDIELQAYGEMLMQNKIGSIVAIDPTNGEILCMVTAPSYDPNMLVGREKGTNFRRLQLNDSLKPLYNRPIQARYPPGSIFKVVQALVGLQMGVINENTGFPCDKSLVGCHNHPSAGNIYSAVQMSCNPYFYRVTNRIINRHKSKSIFKDTELGMVGWTDYMKSFGFGVKLDTDVPNLKSGFIPDTAHYNKYFGKGRWAYSTIYSIAIGQGEVTVIPLQMANLAAIIANKGFYYTPHFLRGVGKEGNVPEKFRQKNYCKVEAKHFVPICEALRRAVNEPGGTGTQAKLENIVVCGKTGTAQNPHGEDHSVFLSFAPMDNPRIAISVYVENGGWGGSVAAPIAGLMIEKYINRTVKDTAKQNRIQKMVLLDRNVKRTNTGGLNSATNRNDRNRRRGHH